MNTWNISQDAGGLVTVQKNGLGVTTQPYGLQHTATSKGGPIRANGYQTAHFVDPATDYFTYSKLITTDSTEDFNFMIIVDSLSTSVANTEYLAKIDATGGNRCQLSVTANGDNLRYEIFRVGQTVIQINTDISHLNDGGRVRVEYKGGIVSLNGEDILKAKYKFDNVYDFVGYYVGHNSSATSTSSGMMLTILEGDIFDLNGNLDSRDSSETLVGDVTFESIPDLNGIIQVDFRPSNDLRFGRAQRFLIDVNNDTVVVDGVDMTGDTAENMIAAINTVLQTDITP